MSQSPNGPYHRNFLLDGETVLIEQVPEELSQSQMMKAYSESSHVSEEITSPVDTHAKHSLPCHHLKHLSMWCENKMQ